MQSWIPDFSRVGALVLIAALGAPMTAGADLFAWRTEDGVFSYTDDRAKIPARYADDAVSVRDSRLAAYPRLTVQDTEATRAVADRLERRLDYLRQVNTPAPQPTAVATSETTTPRSVISVATGSRQAPSLDIAADEAAGPIVVEPVLTKEWGKSRTRRATLVTQGDRTLAVIKGRRHHHDVNEDILDEDALVESR